MAAVWDLAVDWGSVMEVVWVSVMAAVWVSVMAVVWVFAVTAGQLRLSPKLRLILPAFGVSTAV